MSTDPAASVLGARLAKRFWNADGPTWELVGLSSALIFVLVVAASLSFGSLSDANCTQFAGQLGDMIGGHLNAVLGGINVLVLCKIFFSQKADARRERLLSNETATIERMVQMSRLYSTVNRRLSVCTESARALKEKTQRLENEVRTHTRDECTKTPLEREDDKNKLSGAEAELKTAEAAAQSVTADMAAILALVEHQAKRASDEIKEDQFKRLFWAFVEMENSEHRQRVHEQMLSSMRKANRGSGRS